MEAVQEFPWMDALPSGGLHQRRDDAVGFESTVRAGAKADLPEDHHLSQGLFSVIVRGRDSGNAQEGEEMLLGRADEECPQRLGGFEGERPPTDFIQFVDATFFDVRQRVHKVILAQKCLSSHLSPDRLLPDPPMNELPVFFPLFPVSR